MKRLLLVTALGVLLVRPALGADNILTPTTDYEGCKVWTLCDDQDSGTTCVTGSDENIIRAGNAYTFSAWADESDGTGNWTIKLYDRAHGAGYGTQRSLLNSSGDMTISAYKFSWSGLCGDIHAVLGGTLTDGVTLKVKGCPLYIPR